jgi:hypothetical protein
MKALSALAAATLLPVGRRLTAAAQAPDAAKGIPFSAGDVQKQARALAAEKFGPLKGHHFDWNSCTGVFFSRNPLLSMLLLIGQRNAWPTHLTSSRLGQACRPRQTEP